MELFLTIKPEEYTAAILCKQPEILFNFRLAKMLMARGGNIDSNLKWLINSVIAQSSASIGVNPLDWTWTISGAIKSASASFVDRSPSRSCPIRSEYIRTRLDKFGCLPGIAKAKPAT